LGKYYSLKISLLILFFVVSFNIWAQTDSLSGLQKEIFLHPADGFTAYTLKKNELIYNQSPFTLPFPSWAWWGISNNITSEIDLLPLIGGFFQKPYLPVLSFNFRVHVLDQKSILPAMAIETMYQHLWHWTKQSDQPQANVLRKGNSGFLHSNFSWLIKSKFYLHFSTGVTYTQNLKLINYRKIPVLSRDFNHLLSPDVSLSFDFRWKPWISLNMTMSYGTTFVYLDNIPRKQQLAYGFRVAPFYKSRKSFFKTFRAEFIGYNIFLPDIKAHIQSLIPVFPYFYWQWNIN